MLNGILTDPEPMGNPSNIGRDQGPFGARSTFVTQEGGDGYRPLAVDAQRSRASDTAA
jgi:hypothetical protein